MGGSCSVYIDAYKILVESLQGRDHLESVGIIILKVICLKLFVEGVSLNGFIFFYF